MPRMSHKELRAAVLNAPEYLTMQRWLEGEPVLPFAKIIETWGDDYVDWRTRMFRCTRSIDGELSPFKLPDLDLDRMVRRGMLRSLWIGAFGFAIPCAELLDELAKHGPIVEIGAGTGYMTRLMRHRGIDVIGTDAHDAGHGFTPGALDREQLKIEGKTAVRRFPERTVFCSWPTYRVTWFRQALKAMQKGQKIVMIREDACAEDTAWQYLDDHFEELTHITLPQFEHINDYAATYIKRRVT